MIRTSITACIAAATLTAVANADESVVINVAEVDFSDPAQAMEVYDKVVEASETLCTELYLSRALRVASLGTQRRQYTRCVKTTVENTLEATARPELTSAHAAREVESFELAAQ